MSSNQVVSSSSSSELVVHHEPKSGFTRFFKRLRLLFIAVKTVAWVAVKRLLFGPKRPKWSFKLEFLISMIQSLQDDDTPIQKARYQFEKMSKKALIPIRSEPFQIERKDGSSLPLEWIYPQNASPLSESNKQRIILFLHGGAYCIGSINTHRKFAAFFGREASSPVLLVDYRLAPEFPFPAALEDAQLAFRYLVDHLGVCSEQIGLLGDSAGGGLSLCLSLSLLNLEEKYRPGCVACLSPWVNLDIGSEVHCVQEHLEETEEKKMREILFQESTLESNAPFDYLSADLSIFKRYANHYIGESKSRDPFLSPVFASSLSLSRLPPVLFVVGGSEQLYGQVMVMAQRLKQQNEKFEVEVFEDMPHVFQFFGSILPETRQATTRVGQFLVKHLKVSPSSL